MSFLCKTLFHEDREKLGVQRMLLFSCLVTDMTVTYMSYLDVLSESG